MKIVRVKDLGSPGAIIHDDCNTVYVEDWQWDSLSHGSQEFIMLHEQAHCHDGHEGELEADAEAIRDFVRIGGDPADALAALMLLPASPERAARIEQLNNLTMCQACNSKISYFGNTPGYDTLANPLLTEPEAFSSEASTNNAAAQPDPQPAKTNVWDVIVAGLDTVGDVFGQRPNYTLPTSPAPGDSSSGGNTGTLLVIGGLVLLVIAAVVIFKRSAK
jgi:hypothetical protein